MATSIDMTCAQGQALLEPYRKGAGSRVRWRAHIVLLLAQGYSWAVITNVLFCSTRTLTRWKSRGEIAGIGVVLGPTTPPAVGLGVWWREVVAYGVTPLNPRDFGLLRTPWCCRVIAVQLVDLPRQSRSGKTLWGNHCEDLLRFPMSLCGHFSLLLACASESLTSRSL